MHPPLESDLLRVFLAVANAGSVSRAAEKLERTQSAVSGQLKRLEESTGVTLLARGPRGVELTAAGRQLLPQARRIVGLVDETTATMRTAPFDGSVRVGIPEEYNLSILPDVLAAFTNLYPGIEATIFCGYTSQQMEVLADDQIDLAVMFDCEGVTGEVLALDPTVWVESTAHARHLERPVPVAVFWGSNWCRDYAIRSLDMHAVPYRVAFTADTSGALQSAVSTGLAIAPLARSHIPPGARELTLSEGFPIVDSSRVVMKRNPRHGSPAIDGMADLIRKAFLRLSSTAPLPE